MRKWWIMFFPLYPTSLHNHSKFIQPAAIKTHPCPPMSSLTLQSDTHYHFPTVTSQPPFTFPSWTVFRSSSSRRTSNSSTRVYQRFNRGNKISLLPIKSLHVVSSRFRGVSLALACSPPFSALVAATNVDDQTLPLNKACLPLPYLKILYSYVSIAGGWLVLVYCNPHSFVLTYFIIIIPRFAFFAWLPQTELCPNFIANRWLEGHTPGNVRRWSTGGWDMSPSEQGSTVTTGGTIQDEKLCSLVVFWGFLCKGAAVTDAQEVL